MSAKPEDIVSAWMDADCPFWESDSFRHFLKEAMEESAASQLEQYMKSLEKPDCYSSYSKAQYQKFFYGMVRLLKPSSIVEIGVLEGFTTLAMGEALRENGSGRLMSYDLFEDYEFRNDGYDNVSSRIQKAGLDDVVTLIKSDAYEVDKQVSQTDMLHVDISNDGYVFERMFDVWKDKTGIMIFEGGAAQRDQVEWMLKYQKKPLQLSLETIQESNPQWKCYVIEPYPSITVAIKGKHI